MARESRRYIGIELSGAKNNKTALADLEYYPAENKIFLLDIFDRVVAEESQSADEALLALIREFEPGIRCIGVNVPLELPPCIQCQRKTCAMTGKCSAPAVKWMRELNRRMLRGDERQNVRDFTPYTQRPVELWIRYKILSKLGPGLRFEIDETLGGNKAPLTARMHFLKKQLSHETLVEVWPKLTVVRIAEDLKLVRRTVATYRNLEQGTAAREAILEKLIEQKGVFIYDRDLKKLSENLACFDAFICAYTALLAHTGQCEKPPAGFPFDSGWVHYPL